MFLPAAIGKGSGKGGSWTRADWDQFNAKKYGAKIKQEADAEQPDQDDQADASELPEPRYHKQRKGNDFSQYKRQIQHQHGQVLQKQFDLEKQNMELQFKLEEQDLVSQISIVENERDKFKQTAESLETQATEFAESAQKLAAAESALERLQGAEQEWENRCDNYKIRLDKSLTNSKFFQDRMNELLLDKDAATAKIKDLEAQLNSKNKEFNKLQDSYNAKNQEFDKVQDSYAATLLELELMQAAS